MGTSADLLVQACREGRVLTPAVLVDYFGSNACYEDRVDILRHIYTDMICNKQVSAALLYNCFLTERLDELIHAKHARATTPSYEEMVSRRIFVGRTLLVSLPHAVQAVPLIEED